MEKIPLKWWEKEGVIYHPYAGPMLPDRYFNPINNIIPAVRSQFGSMPDKVVIEDDTLREGVECPHGLWKRTEMETRVKVAKALLDAGIKEVQVGFVATDIIAQEMVKALQDETPELKLVSHVGTTKENIDGNVDRGVVRGWMLLSLNDYAVQQYDWCRKDTEAHIVEDIAEYLTNAIEYAKERGMYILASTHTPSHSPINRVMAVYKAVVDAGGDGVCCMDGMGSTIPEAFKVIVGIARGIIGPDKDIETHCHDDYGLGTANCVSCVTAGANRISCSVNGLGDRAGIGSMCEIVPTLEILYGVDTGVDLEKLWALSKMVQELYGIKVQQNSAIVGENTYVHEEDPHIARILRAKAKEGRWQWWAYNTINPEYLGRKEYLHWGGSSMHKGPQSCTALKIAELGLPYDEMKLDEILKRLISIAKEKRYATEEEVEETIKEVYGSK